jgi:hypothetical protein
MPRPLDKLKQAFSKFRKSVKSFVEPTPHKKDDEPAKAEDDTHSSDSGSTGGRVDGWRAAESILKLREQVNRLAPHRSRASDGIIGDTSHKNRKSDHNPWIIDDGFGVVSAIDITHDPQRDCDAGRLAELIAQSRDNRVKYIIWNRRIANSKSISGKPAWAWRSYNGANPHTKHVHISVLPDEALYDDTSDWQIDGLNGNKPTNLRSPTAVARSFNDSAEIAWGQRVSAAFKSKTVEISNRLQVDPSILMAVMAFETGRTFDPAIRNSASGATGLIQFMPNTAQSLGTTTTKLAKMEAVDQLDFIEAYLRPFTGKMGDLASAYMAVLWPKAVSEPLSVVLFAHPKKAYRLNKGLDVDDDGKVTKAEASAKVERLLVEGMRPENIG